MVLKSKILKYSAYNSKTYLLFISVLCRQVLPGGIPSLYYCPSAVFFRRVIMILSLYTKFWIAYDLLDIRHHHL